MSERIAINGRAGYRSGSCRRPSMSAGRATPVGDRPTLRPNSTALNGGSPSRAEACGCAAVRNALPPRSFVMPSTHDAGRPALVGLQALMFLGGFASTPVSCSRT